MKPHTLNAGRGLLTLIPFFMALLLGSCDLAPDRILVQVQNYETKQLVAGARIFDGDSLRGFTDENGECVFDVRRWPVTVHARSDGLGCHPVPVEKGSGEAGGILGRGTSVVLRLVHMGQLFVPCNREDGEVVKDAMVFLDQTELTELQQRGVFFGEFFALPGEHMTLTGISARDTITARLRIEAHKRYYRVPLVFPPPRIELTFTVTCKDVHGRLVEAGPVSVGGQRANPVGKGAYRTSLLGRPGDIVEILAGGKSRSKTIQDGKTVYDLEISGLPAVEEPPRRPPQPQYASVTITTMPAGSDISIDGELRGASPLTVSRVEPGRHTIWADPANPIEYFPVEREFTVEAGDNVEIPTIVHARIISDGELESARAALRRGDYRTARDIYAGIANDSDKALNTRVRAWIEMGELIHNNPSSDNPIFDRRIAVKCFRNALDYKGEVEPVANFLLGKTYHTAREYSMCIHPLEAVLAQQDLLTEETREIYLPQTFRMLALANEELYKSDPDAQYLIREQEWWKDFLNYMNYHPDVRRQYGGEAERRVRELSLRIGSAVSR